MEFLSDVPALALSEEGGKQITFCADLLQPRPPFEVIQGFASDSVKVQAQMAGVLQRKTCPVAWVALFVDETGTLAVFHFKQRLMLQHAKTAAEAVLKALPDPQRRVVGLPGGLRPLDELDRERIRAWKTVAAVRPEGDEDSSDSEAEEEKQVFFASSETPRAPPPTAAPTAAELLTTFEEEQVVKRRRLDQPGVTSALSRNMASAALGHAPIMTLNHAANFARGWIFLAQQSATVHVASAGERPATLSYIRCHREARRVQLLVEHLRKQYNKIGLLTVVRAAVQMAKEGSLPGPDGPRARKTEFIRRCEEALALCEPEAERTTPSCEIRRRIAHIIDGTDAPRWDEQMCMGCGHKDPGWIATDHGWSRCARCKFPKVFGRTVTGLSSILRPAVEREKAEGDRMAMHLHRVSKQ